MRAVYQKYKEVIHYGIIGGCTTVLGWGLYLLFEKAAGLGVDLSNALSIIGAVTFAYVTNKRFVFYSRTETPAALLKELLGFLASRGATMALEFFGVMGLKLLIGGFYAKMCLTAAVIILNYVLSKVFVFNRGKKG